jgi:DNA polymerase-3 subunit delta'
LSTAPPAPAANPLLLGHEAAEAIWLRAWRSGRLPHGWLLTGPMGVGKATLAYRMARRLLAGDRAATEPPAADSGLFRMIAHGGHPDLHVLSPDSSGRKLRPEIKVDEVRAIQEKLYATSAMGGARILLVDAADELNRNAANALLKLLEEPPAAHFLLLVCHRPGALPRTIASRCAQLRLRPLPQALVEEGLLRLGPELPAGRDRLLASLADGSLGRAFDLEAQGWPEAYAALLATLEQAGGADPLPIAEQLAAIGRQQGFPVAVDLLGGLIRRAARIAAGAALAVPLVPDEPARLRALGPGLDRWVGLWDKLGASAGQTEGLNLDPLQTFLGLVQGIGGGAAAAAR